LAAGPAVDDEPEKADGWSWSNYKSKDPPLIIGRLVRWRHVFSWSRRPDQRPASSAQLENPGRGL